MKVITTNAGTITSKFDVNDLVLPAMTPDSVHVVKQVRYHEVDEGFSYDIERVFGEKVLTEAVPEGRLEKYG